MVDVSDERAEAVATLDPLTTGTLDRARLLVRHPVQVLGWRRVRLASFAAWFLALATVIVVRGVPTSRLPLAAFIVSLLVISRLGHGRTALQRVILDWLPFTAVLLMYDGSRALVTKVGVPVHVTDVAHAEAWLFGGVQPAVWLQNHLYDAAHPLVVHWYDALCTLVYTSHFLATPIVAAVLWVRDRDDLGALHAPGHRAVGGGPAHLRRLPRGPAVARGQGRRDRPGLPAVGPRLDLAARRARERPCWPTPRAAGRTRSRPCRRCTRPSPP